ncbi:MAG: hypothetical protein KAG28_04675 [Cocleimonas sp.]|nr:hypothetical protein [Cocleimonas sp.]
MTCLNPLTLVSIIISLFILTACGSSGESPSTPNIKTTQLTVNGKPLSGIHYQSGKTTGTTNHSGTFHYEIKKQVSFSLSQQLLGRLSASSIKTTVPTTLKTVVNASSKTKPIIKQLPELYKNFDLGKDYIQSPSYSRLINSTKEKVLTLNNKPLKGIKYQSGNVSGTTDEYGLFNYQSGKTIAFTLAGKYIGSASPNKLPISLEQLVTTAKNPVIKHLPLLLTDLNPKNATTFTAGFSLYRLEQALFKPDSLPLNRSLGINLETPQAEADGIYQPLPFVDIFRVSRPFKENSCPDVNYDRSGWPLSLPKSCASKGDKKYIMTRTLQFMPSGAAPVGRYHLLFDGKGIISVSGMGSNKQKVAEGHYTIDLKALPKNQQIHGLEVFITKLDEADPIRNLRIVMSGGICKGNPFKRVVTQQQCSNDHPYIAFVDVLKNNRNTIVFNPDYLRFHKDFRVLRMMNFMEATPRRPLSNSINPCPNEKTYAACLTRERSWSQIAKMSDASWGGSYKTIVTKRFGVPLNVSVALSNLLQSHPWFTLPFNASNAYIDQYADYLKVHLDKPLKAHIEYSNEFWNGGFWGSHYTVAMGKKLGLHKPALPYRSENHTARVRFYAKRSVEIFQRFETVFGSTKRLVRIIGSYHKSRALSQELLSYKQTAKSTDVLAVAPYAHGCWSRSRTINNSEIEIAQCSNTTIVPKVFTEATSLDDIFTVMNSIYTPSAKTTAERGDTDSLSAIIQIISSQVAVAKEFNVDLYAYEGGQHLKVEYGDLSLSNAKKKSLQDFFTAANQDSRMGDIYEKLLTEWKQRGGKQFMLFTSPQSFNRYGFFGIKEYMNQPRTETPKYDAAMTFQEAVAGCWWTGCKDNF